MKKSQEYFDMIEKAKEKKDHNFVVWLWLNATKEKQEENKEILDNGKELLYDCG